VLELGGGGVVRVEQVHRIEPARGAVVVGEDLEPVVHAARTRLGALTFGPGAVAEGRVRWAVALVACVVRARKSGVALPGQARDLVRAARDRRRPDRRATARTALHLLEVETRAERVAALADQRPAARVPPDPVRRRVRAAVRFSSEHPEDLRVGLLEDL